jgi:hypothetical protein
MTSVVGRTAKAERSLPAVLCGVEALSAQQIERLARFSLCAELFFARGGPAGRGPPKKEFAELILRLPHER